MQMSIPTQTTQQFAETPTAQNAPETYQYDVEIPSLMSTIVNAVYSSKDYAIRELVSNASDALDKYNQMYHIFQSEQATTVKDNKKDNKKDKNYDELNNNEINNNNNNNYNNIKDQNYNNNNYNNGNNIKENNIKENNIKENNNNKIEINNNNKDNLVRCRLTAPGDLRIKIEVSGNTIIFSDNGIGMTKPDLVNFLGKIAASGTKAFKEQIASKNFKSESELGALIGQFGLGFYSAFLIADSVRVVTRHPRDRCYAWESRGLGDFTVQECEDEMEHGTRVILSVKEGDEKYKSESLLEELVKKYSMFMPYPLYILKEEEVDDIENNDIENKDINNDIENNDIENEGINNEGINNDINKEENNNDIENKDENNKDINKGDNNEINKDIINIEENNDINKEDVPEIKEIKEVKKKKIMKPTLINKNKPVWLKRPADCTKEEYSAFYKDISNDWEDFSFMKHVTLDGLISLTLLLFVPKRSRLNMFEKQKKDNIKLYVKNVFVTDDLKDAQPDWMTFVSGVISSDDVPMNLSRETIQGSNTMKMIKNNLPRKVLDMVEDISEDREKYEAFLKEFGSNLKMGVRDNTGQMQERIARLLRYYSSKSEDKLTSLDEYIEKNIEKNNEKNNDINNNNEKNNNSNNNNNNDSNKNNEKNKNNNDINNNNIKENNNSESKQKVIYILTGLSKDEVVNSPFLDLYKDKEVLFMYEPVDEIMLQGLRSYKGYDIKRITSEGASELGKVDEHTKECFKDFISAYKDLLSKEVERIDLRNLGSAPCVISSQAYSHSAAMENIIRSQPGQENNPFLAMMGRSKKIFEINPNNSMVRNIKTCWENKDAEWKSMATLFYNTAVVECGFKMDDGVSYAKNVFSILGECLKMRCVKGQL